MTGSYNPISKLKEIISREKKAAEEINSMFKSLENAKSAGERRIILAQIASLKAFMREANKIIPQILKEVNIPKPLTAKPLNKIQKKQTQKASGKKPGWLKFLSKGPAISDFEKRTLKRLKKNEKKEVKREVKKQSEYLRIANSIFSDISAQLIKKEMFSDLKRDLIKANLNILPKTYMSAILFTTLLSFIAAIFIFSFLLFFSIGAVPPFVTLVKESIGMRFLKTFWILFVIPVVTFVLMYTYPSMEKKVAGKRIDRELPFATIHMSAISGSMIEPSKIFSIIVSTKEYPYLEKEFTKLINEINVLGYDLVTSLRNSASRSPSKKLAELFNGLATTISSGGDLPVFFEKRAQTMLFDYRIEMEKQTRAAETFMDIYISVVIAAPMILMLLLMMMKISGLGVPVSSSMITLIMTMGVSMINIAFLTFLHLKQENA